MTRKGDRKASTEGLSKEEIAAMKDRLKELNSGKNEGEGAVTLRATGNFFSEKNAKGLTYYAKERELEVNVLREYNILFQ